MEMPKNELENGIGERKGTKMESGAEVSLCLYASFCSAFVCLCVCAFFIFFLNLFVLDWMTRTLEASMDCVSDIFDFAEEGCHNAFYGRVTINI